MDAIDGFRRPCPRRSVRTALPPAASSPMSCDTGRAAAGRAGSFNSGKNARRVDNLTSRLSHQIPYQPYLFSDSDGSFRS